MANTPHISIRVSPDRLAEWKWACEENGIDLSFQIRRLMDTWSRIEIQKKLDEIDDLEQQQRLAEQAGKILDTLNSVD